jgi:hypothetical protein
MNQSRYAQIQARATGLRRVRATTRWSAAAGVALAMVFGGAFAQARLAAANDGTDQTGTSSQDDGGGITTDDQPPTTQNGSTISPPTQTPRGSTGGHSHVRSGGS